MARSLDHRAPLARRRDLSPRLGGVVPPSTEGIAVDDAGDAIIVTDGSGKAGTICELPSTWKRLHLAEPPVP